jgi:hypothetical protein
MGSDVNVSEEAVEGFLTAFWVSAVPRGSATPPGHWADDSMRRNIRAGLQAAAPAIRSQERERVREAIYQEMTHRTGLADHELIAALDRAESALDTLEADHA